MEDIVWLLLALIVVLVALGVVLARLRRWSTEINLNPRHCPNCETPMSLRRVSLIQTLTFKGMWMCPHCGNRIKSRKATSLPAS
jgi:ribosomal protein L37AE/L43A